MSGKARNRGGRPPKPVEISLEFYGGVMFQRGPLVIRRRVVEEIDHKLTGSIARNLRIAQGKTMKEVGEKMGLSFQVVQHLEMGDGNRAWTERLAMSYLMALQGESAPIPKCKPGGQIGKAGP